jgi:predicted XRE-type DNA-binding protein
MSKENASPKGHSWSDAREQLLMPEERAASALRMAMMIEIANARKERGLSQRKLDELSGVKQLLYTLLR